MTTYAAYERSILGMVLFQRTPGNNCTILCRLGSLSLLQYSDSIQHSIAGPITSPYNHVFPRMERISFNSRRI